jgi:hypothetical protein
MKNNKYNEVDFRFVFMKNSLFLINIKIKNRYRKESKYSTFLFSKLQFIQ